MILPQRYSDSDRDQTMLRGGTAGTPQKPSKNRHRHLGLETLEIVTAAVTCSRSSPRCGAPRGLSEQGACDPVIPKGDRMDIFRDNNVVIGSRVADEGLSLDSLDRVIEFDFHGGSRRQELQRAGRVMHSEGLGQHLVQMTDEEFDDYGQRLYSLEEKGIDIRVERRA